jgi:GNAT superfamily N-acetyltransferase
MLTVRQLPRNDDFWRILGPYIGSRQVAKEVGINLYADADKVFWLAEQHGQEVGFASVRGGLISDCYVLPAFRRRGVFTSLLIAMTMQPRDYRATCTRMSRGAFEKQGFKVVKETKNFTHMEKRNA